MSDVAAQPPSADTGSLRNMAIVVHGLMGAGMFLFGLPTLVGLVIAYLKRGDAAGTIYESHLTYAIRTFWIGFALSLLGSLLLIVVIGLPVLIFSGIWFVVRIVRAVLSWLDGKPIENPRRFF